MFLKASAIWSLSLFYPSRVEQMHVFTESNVDVCLMVFVACG